jgi:hypothetical protein
MARRRVRRAARGSALLSWRARLCPYGCHAHAWPQCCADAQCCSSRGSAIFPSRGCGLFAVLFKRRRSRLANRIIHPPSRYDILSLLVVGTLAKGY